MNSLIAMTKVVRLRRKLHAFVIFTVGWFTFVRSQSVQQFNRAVVHVALISNYSPNFKEVKWLAKLSLLSAVEVFELRRAEISAHLRVHVACSTPGLSARKSQQYTEAMYTTLKTEQEYFDSFRVVCSRHLPHAIEQSSEELSHRNQKDVFFILLEHDWILRPSYFFVSFAEFLEFSKTHDIQYLLFQRGDRQVDGKLLHSSPNIFQFNTYSNNPFICTREFLSGMLAESRVCGDTSCSMSGEMTPIKVFESRLDHFTKRWKMNKQMAIVGGVGDIAAYHADAKFVWHSALDHSGPIFNNSLARYNAFKLLSSTQVVRDLIRELDSNCRTDQHSCDVYHERENFIRRVLEYEHTWLEGCDGAAALIASYVLHVTNSLEFLDTTLVPQVLNDAEIRRRCGFRY